MMINFVLCCPFSLVCCWYLFMTRSITIMISVHLSSHSYSIDVNHVVCLINFGTIHTVCSMPHDGFLFFFAFLLSHKTSLDVHISDSFFSSHIYKPHCAQLLATKDKFDLYQKDHEIGKKLPFLKAGYVCSDVLSKLGNSHS